MQPHLIFLLFPLKSACYIAAGGTVTNNIKVPPLYRNWAEITKITPTQYTWRLSNTTNF